MPRRIPQPGDIDFDWSKYSEWRRATPDPIADAKAALARASQLAKETGLPSADVSTPDGGPSRRTYRVANPQGQTVSFDGPVGMSKGDLVARAKQEMSIQSGEIPTSFVTGAAKSLEDDRATRDALLNAGALALPVAGPAAIATAAAVPFVGSGLKMLSHLFRTGTLEAPSAEELTGDAVEAALTVGAGPAIKTGARAIGATKDAVSAFLPPWVRVLARGSHVLNPKGLAMDVATSKPVLRAAEELGDAIDPRNIRRTFANVGRGLRPGVAPAEAAPIVDRYLPNRSRLSREVPGSSYVEPPAPASSTFTPTSDALKEMPLYQQMAYLPDVSRSATARIGVPSDTRAVSRGITKRITTGAEPPYTSAMRRFDEVIAGLRNAPAAVRQSVNRVRPSAADIAADIQAGDALSDAAQSARTNARPAYVNGAEPPPSITSLTEPLTIPLDRWRRILRSFANPETETPFDRDLFELILKDPDGAEFAKAYGPSGRR